MNLELYQRAREVFLDVRDRAPADQVSLIEIKCGNDRELRDLVRQLLEHDDTAGSFLDPAKLGHLGYGGQQTPGPSAGDTIGPYHLLGVLGEGGFGVVWLAERREPFVQRVALKILKAGMDSRAVLARFEQERQALAMMDHPNVARVLDGGMTPDNRPYFVMEYVNGRPITEYADDARLTLRERLGLFIPVCEALQHAHMKGIVHRDIKPNNVLVEEVDGRPAPKVIDFGIAKALSQSLTDKTIFTESGQLIGTFEYMSPEQAAGLADVDIRTDVYSLGVLLYQLLSGALPFDSRELREAGLAEIHRIIRDVDPPRPSARLSQDHETATEFAKRRNGRAEDLARQLRQELEWIPLRALRKARKERYQSAKEIADDIHNYLSGRPLLAGPDSATYIARKFVRRHKVPVTAAAAVVLVLTAGIAGTSWGFVRAAQRAEQERIAKEQAKEATRAAVAASAAATTAKTEAVRAREDAELESYVANLIAADASLSANELARVHTRLDACPERLRGWEWRWLNASADVSLIRFVGHRLALSTAEFSPNGDRVVTGSADGTARVWDTVTGQVLAVLQGDAAAWQEQIQFTGLLGSPVHSAVFSPDGHRVASIWWDGKLHLWAADSGKELLVRPAQGGHGSRVAFSPDGSRIVASVAGANIRVWDATTGAELHALGAGPITDTDWERRKYLAFVGSNLDVSGTHGVTMAGDVATVWDTISGTQLRALQPNAVNLAVTAFDAAGSRLALRSRDGVEIWLTQADLGPMRLSGRGNMKCMAFNSTGNRLAAGYPDGSVVVWEVDGANEPTTLRGPTHGVEHVAFSPDGARVATAADDCTARLWDAASGRELAVLRGHSGPVRSVAFSPDGRLLLTASDDKTARIWDALMNAEWTPANEPEQVLSAVYTPAGLRVLARSQRSVMICDSAVAQKSILSDNDDVATFAVLSDDGSRAVIQSGQDTWRLWDLSDLRKPVALPLHDAPSSGLFAAFSSDASRVVIPALDGLAQICDTATGMSLLTLRPHNGVPAQSYVSGVSISHDGTRIAIATMDGAYLWDSTTGEQLTPRSLAPGFVRSVMFSPDGSRLVASLRNEVDIIGVTTGDTELLLTGHNDLTGPAAFSPDGTRVVSASKDGTARVWDAASGKELALLRPDGGSVRYAAFSPDGTRVITIAGRGRVQVWDSVPYSERFRERQTRSQSR